MNRRVKSRVINLMIAMLLSLGAFPSVVQASEAIVQQPAQEAIVISGKVTDDTGEALPGVSVMLKSDAKIGTATDIEGNYRLRIPTANDVLLFTYLGMRGSHVTVKPGQTVYNVKMEYEASALTEVIISAGIIERDKVSFTGSVASFSGEELREIGGTNILQNLSVLDPSFVIIENDLMGSNPNATAQIEINGQSSLSISNVEDQFAVDPNQPLFVLDGVEVAYKRIKDLDINRIASIVLLKDAGSTAIYGSRAANGVVVVETKKPEAGELRVYYTGTFGLSTPDLSVYNLMDAAEKLEYERLAGRYSANKGNAESGAEYYGEAQKALDALYNQRLSDVQSGVNTYWLSEPVRTAVTHGHSVRVSGGGDELTIDVGGSFKNHQGVMKGSDRRTYAGNSNIQYRNKKITITNSTDITGYTANESPYGKFSDFADANPYFKKYDEDGAVTRYLQEGSTTSGGYVIASRQYNPLYNAKLNSLDQEKSFQVSNTLQGAYRMNDYFRFKLGWDLLYNRDESDVYKSPLHTDFETTDKSRKGTYTHGNTSGNTYKLHLTASYAQVFNDAHSVSYTTRGEIRDETHTHYAFKAEGFSNQSKGKPNLANQYAEGGSPEYSESLYRAASWTNAFNYNYKQRYLLDLSYTLEGSTSFGSNRKFQDFGSVGVGWNVYKETFAEDWEWVDLLKIRATYGTTGNQNISSYYSSSVYTYNIYSNIFGDGISLSQLANPDLPWMVNYETAGGVDLGFMDGRLTATFDIYKKKADPQILSIPQAPSTGLNNYPIELGWMDIKGGSFKLNYSPIYNKKARIIWTLGVSGSNSRSVYRGFTTELDGVNNSAQNSETDALRMQRYQNGKSPSDIWAVRSLGIDPATGEEVFLTKEGNPTFQYNVEDKVVVGSTRPDLQGTISSMFRYGKVYFNAYFSYSYGSEKLNSSLYNRVENISSTTILNNLDRRALYNRWREPGDIAQFKSISILETSSEISSRFIQKNNYLNMTSATVGYELDNNPWVNRNLGVKTVRFAVSAQDLFRWETSKTERGLEYPFARSFDMTINLSF